LHIDDILNGRYEINSPLMKGVPQILKSIDDPNDLRNLLKSKLILNKVHNIDKIDTDAMIKNMNRKENN
jgi:hypothetical protein